MPHIDHRGKHEGPLTMVRRFVTDEDAPRAARALADRVLTDLGRRAEHRRADLELVVSEMVSNAVVHGPPGEVEFRMIASDELIRVEVSDHGVEPFTRRHELSPAGHWGLGLVEEFSDRFGVERKPWTCVWCELDLKAQRITG